jgi:hypothetical protein
MKQNFFRSSMTPMQKRLECLLLASFFPDDLIFASKAKPYLSGAFGGDLF